MVDVWLALVANWGTLAATAATATVTVVDRMMQSRRRLRVHSKPHGPSGLAVLIAFDDQADGQALAAEIQLLEPKDATLLDWESAITEDPLGGEIPHPAPANGERRARVLLDEAGRGHGWPSGRVAVVSTGATPSAVTMRVVVSTIPDRKKRISRKVRSSTHR